MSTKIAYLAGDIGIHSFKFLEYLSSSENYEVHLITFTNKEVPNKYIRHTNIARNNVHCLLFAFVLLIIFEELWYLLWIQGYTINF